jgi:hypothetical protein
MPWKEALQWTVFEGVLICLLHLAPFLTWLGIVTPLAVFGAFLQRRRFLLVRQLP